MGATLSNYALLGLRLLSTVVLTRALFTTFASEDYGFWALLWSVFAYALLLDFGLGTALQKYTSQWRAGHERNYGALLSTALTLYTGMGLLMALGTWGLSSQLQWLLPELSPEDFGRYQQAFFRLWSGHGIALSHGLFCRRLTWTGSHYCAQWYSGGRCGVAMGTQFVGAKRCARPFNGHGVGVSGHHGWR